MDANLVKAAMIRVLQRVQARRGLDCPPLQGSSVPVRALPKFTSKVWPAATTWLARELGIRIPKDVHLFGSKKGGPPLTIDQAIALVCSKSEPATVRSEAAE